MARLRRVPKQREGMQAKAGTTKSETACLSKRVPPYINGENLNYMFTAKEMDEETGLYYYGARYLDPKYSRWLSTDPAIKDYIPAAGKATADEISNLPGMGGLYNSVNSNLYHYAGNNPVKYTDPDGRFLGLAVKTALRMLPKHHSEGFLYFDKTQPQRYGGYFNLYEAFTSNDMCCNIDSLRTDFTSSSGKTSSIWFWKGNYNMVFNGGWHVGAEIGAYGSLGEADNNMFCFFSIKKQEYW